MKHISMKKKSVSVTVHNDREWRAADGYSAFDGGAYERRTIAFRSSVYKQYVRFAQRRGYAATPQQTGDCWSSVGNEGQRCPERGHGH